MLRKIFASRCLLLFLIPLIFSLSISRKNNACSNFKDYLFADISSNCFYDPDASLESPQLIRKYAGSVETHEVTSLDGYVTTLFRISPKKPPKGVVLLHHSIGTDARLFLWDGNSSLAFDLWNAGYDVWLANHRGTFFSQHHAKNLSGYKYWDFSFHEIALYDLSAELQLINSITNNKVIFIGHSLGATVGLIYSALKPTESRDLVKLFAYISTPCYFKFNDSFPIKFRLTDIEPIIRAVIETFHIGAAIIFIGFIKRTSSTVVRTFPVIILIVNLLLLLICGWTPGEGDSRFFAFDSGINLRNFPVKMLLHYLQLMATKTRFQMFDYGRSENLRIYGSETPPVYPSKNITVPTYLISSLNDSFITSADSQYLFEELPETVKVYGQMVVSGLNHLDFLIGRHKHQIYIDKLLSVLDLVN